MSNLTLKQLAELRRLLDCSVARPRYRAARGHKLVVLARGGERLEGPTEDWGDLK